MFGTLATRYSCRFGTPGTFLWTPWAQVGADHRDLWWNIAVVWCCVYAFLASMTVLRLQGIDSISETVFGQLGSGRNMEWAECQHTVPPSVVPCGNRKCLIPLVTVWVGWPPFDMANNTCTGRYYEYIFPHQGRANHHVMALRGLHTSNEFFFLKKSQPSARLVHERRELTSREEILQGNRTTYIRNYPTRARTRN